jgi:trigger factor
MDVTVKQLKNSQVELSVVLPWEEWKDEMTHAADSLAKQIKVSGFRPGKAPRDVIEKRLGAGAILAEAVEHAVNHSYGKALTKEKIEAIGHPDVKLGKFAEGAKIEYTATTAVMPEVKIKSWHDAVKKANASSTKKETVLEESEIEGELRRIAEMRAKLVTVAREAKTGDNVLVDFVVKQDGVIIEGGKSENHPLVLGKGVFIPGFEEELVGMKENDEKTFTLSFPKEYHAKHLAGKPAEFSVKIRAVQDREIPALDDAFAKSLGRFESLEQVKENIRTGMLEEKKTKQKEARRAAILDALIDRSEIDFPQILVDEESYRMVREFEQQVAQMGMSFEDFLAQSKKTEDDMRKEWEPQAKKRIAANMLLLKVAEEEGIEVDTDAVEAEMNKALQYYKNVKDAEKNLDMSRLYTAVRGQLLNEKVFEALEKI